MNLARVLWFDDLSGEGILSLEDGSSCFIHWSAIKGLKGEKKNGKTNWVSLQPGWIGRYKMVTDTTFRQISEFRVTKKAKPIKTESCFIDRDLMKRKLVAADAAFDELMPDFKEFDELYTLRKVIDPSSKQLKRLEALEELRKIYNKSFKKWSEDKTAFKVSIYKEHDRFYLTSNK